MNCSSAALAGTSPGRRLYNQNCYFCHGYSGNAQTVAAQMLTPPPRDFTNSPDLTQAGILDALQGGRDGTAMRSFAGQLSGDEMRDVAEFVMEAFVECQHENTRYHTVENGWPDHELRYAAAFPFATGEYVVDAPAAFLSEIDLEGLELFRSACVSCHEGRTSNVLSEHVFGDTTARASDEYVRVAADDHLAHEAGEYGARTIHDIHPVIRNMTDTERLGAELYEDACEICHAADGSGQNWIGAFLEPHPTDFTEAGFAVGFDIERFVRSTLDAKAGTTMPSFRGVLADEEVRAVADYVRRAFVSGEPHGK